jgi:ATP adenylyltransferase
MRSAVPSALAVVLPFFARKTSGRCTNPAPYSLLLMVRPLWAPWRLEYVQHADEEPGCLFCRAQAGDDDALLVHRAGQAIALLNKFPYASGHLMIAPVRHVGELGDLDDEEALSLHRLAVQALGALSAAYAPQGYNLGWNLGRIAGAGIVDHVHLHVVPRWAGDTNFMPVLADVKVLPEHLVATRRRLAEAWPR